MSERIINDYESQISRLKKQLSQLQSDNRQKMQLNWREVESRAPCEMSRRHDAVVNEEGSLCIIYEGQVYEYCKNHWSDLPPCP